MTRRPGYIPTLDGWRALAITAVFFAHMRLLLPGRLGQKIAFFLWVNGGLGVDIFFAISGLLICSRLLDEEDRVGSISLKKFYVRRAFRILPPALAFLLVLAVLHQFGLIQYSRLDWFASLFFFRNYTVNLSGPPLAWWFTSHFWSLSVEEQFYLVLPALLVLLPRRRLTALITLAGLSAGWKFYVQHFLHLDPTTSSIWIRFHTAGSIDSLLVPAALAIFMRNPPSERFFAYWLRPGIRLLVMAACAAYVFYRFQPWPWARIAAPLIILATVYNPNSFAGRFLELRMLRWVGRLSYSLYLWQMLFFCTRFPVEPPLGQLQIFPWDVAALVGCACLSYYLIEQPCIRAGYRLTSSLANAHPQCTGVSSMTEASKS